MPFPNAARAPVENQNCTIGVALKRTELLTRLNVLGDRLSDDTRLRLPDSVPGRASAVVYLGLCRLKQASETGSAREWADKCADLERDLKIGEGKKSLNCSYFVGGQAGFNNHRRIIQSAMGVYLPDMTSMKKRALILLAIGSLHNKDVEVPATDAWVVDYRFPIP